MVDLVFTTTKNTKTKTTLIQNYAGVNLHIIFGFKWIILLHDEFNLSVSGSLQNPITNLLSVSSNIIDGKVGKIIGVSIPQFLTRNETTLPNNFTTINTTDNILLNSNNSTNSYFQLVNTTYTGLNQFYIGLFLEI